MKILFFSLNINKIFFSLIQLQIHSKKISSKFLPKTLKKILLLFVSSAFFVSCFYGATNSSVPQLKSSYGGAGVDVLVTPLDFNKTPSGSVASTDPSLIYTGIIFNGYSAMNIDPNKTVIVHITKATAGDYRGWSGMLFRGSGSNGADPTPHYSINGGSITFNLGSFSGPHRVEGVFITLKHDGYEHAPVFTFDTNLTMQIVSNDFYIARGLFTTIKGGAFIFNRNLIIDASLMKPSVYWGGSKNGYRAIFSVGGIGKVLVNSRDDAANSVVNAKNIVQLKGDIYLEEGSKANSKVAVNLTNPESYFQGRFSFQGAGKAFLNLKNGGKWYLIANSAVSVLDMQNLNPESADETNLSLVDFISIKDGETSLTKDDGRINDTLIFNPRHLTIDTLKGSGGIFKIIANYKTQTSDDITIVNESNGTHYIQIYPDYSSIWDFTKPTPNVIQVANILNGGRNLFFDTKPVKIGLFVFKANLNKIPEGAGHKWVIGEASRTDSSLTPFFFVDSSGLENKIANLLGIQYKIYRIHAYNVTKHIDELFLASEYLRQHIWADYGSGRLSDKHSSSTFHNFQGGYDYAWEFGKFRVFVGGLGDYTLINSISSYSLGKTHSLGMGIYSQGSWYFQKNFGLDADIYGKYAFNHTEENAKKSFEYNNFNNNYNLAFLNLRLGFKAPLSADNSWFIEPGAKFSFGFVDTAKTLYKTSTPSVDEISGEIISLPINIHINQDSAKILGKELFVLVGKIYQTNSLYFDIKAGLSFIHDSNTGGNISMIQDGFLDRPIHFITPDDKRLGLQISSNLAISDKVKFYFHFKNTFFSAVNTNYFVSAGLRINLDFFTKSKNKSLTPSKESFRNRNLRPSQTSQENTQTTNTISNTNTTLKPIVRPNQRPLPRLKRQPQIQP